MIMALILKSVLFKVILLFSFVSLISLDNPKTESGRTQDGKVKSTQTHDEVHLEPNERYFRNEYSPFVIFCYENIPKTILQLWRGIQLVLENAPVSYDVFPGNNASEVLNQYESKSIFQPSLWLFGQKTVIDYPAFSPYCVGISSKEKYSVHFRVKIVNYWKVLQTVVGVMLFLCAPSLSRNPFFHYTSFVSLGVFGSLLVALYVLSRFIPRKSTSYAILFCGYSFILYLFQSIWKDLSEILTKYTDWVLVYCLVAAFVSFLVCYRMGPVQNVRTFHVIQWCMQILAVLLIFLSSEYREVSTAIIIILIGARLVPLSWITKCQQIWYYYCPPKVQLLTELEFIEQGHVESRKALDNLRKYCSSPDCNVWKTVSRLKDPQRFAKFIESGSHFTDEELLLYTSVNDEEDDDDEEDADDSSGNTTPNHR